ncbi:hypothetical protein FRX31_009046, partial [Thalictrum thalictroides]
MNANPNRTKTLLNKSISTFNGSIVVASHDSYESPLLTKVPGLSEGEINFVEVPIESHEVILGIPWLETVNPNIDWVTKSVSSRPIHYSSPTITPQINSENQTRVQSDDLHINVILRKDAQVENDNLTLPKNLKHMADVFSATNAKRLPPYRPGIDMKIDTPE